MRYRFRALIVVLAVAIGALTLAACGGGKKSSSSSSGAGGSAATNVLDQTFSGSHSVKSGKLSLHVVVALHGSGAPSAPIDIKLDGPFQGQGGKQLPKFDLNLVVGIQGQTINAGLATDAKSAVVKFQGKNYSIPANIYSQFKQGFDQAQAKAPKSKNNLGLKQLGIDPVKLIKNPTVVGDEDVAGTATTHVTAPIDVDQLIATVDTLLGKAGSLGVPQTGSVPSKLTDAQKQDIRNTIKGATIDFWSGKDDHTLRKVRIKATIAPPKTGSSKLTSGDLSIELQLSEVNKDQTITLPTNTQPITALTSQLGGLGGALGGLGGSSGSGSSGSGSSGSGAGTGAATKNLQKYETCIQQAGTDLSKAQKCAKLLTG